MTSEHSPMTCVRRYRFLRSSNDKHDESYYSAYCFGLDIINLSGTMYVKTTD